MQDRQKSLDLIEDYHNFWMQIIGTRLNVGKKTVNAQTQFKNHFDESSVNITDDMLDAAEIERWEKKREKYVPVLDNNLWEM